MGTLRVHLGLAMVVLLLLVLAAPQGAGAATCTSSISGLRAVDDAGNLSSPAVVKVKTHFPEI